MNIIYNDIIPFTGFKAVNLLGVLFVRNGATLTDIDINHEAIHTAQMKETLYVGFYLWYVMEWLARLIATGFKAHRAYRAVSFEREAYANQDDMQYLAGRRHYSFLGYMSGKET